MSVKAATMNKRGLGFTLLELIICTIIIILLAAGLANIFVVGKGYIARTKSQINSAEIAKHFLAPMHSQVRQDVWSSTGNCVGNFMACPSAAENIDGVAYTPVFNITNVTGTTLRRVKVRIDWTAP